METCRTLLKRLNEDENKINWASLTRNLLLKLGFADVWMAQGVGNTHHFLNMCKQRLHDQFRQCKAGLEKWRLVQIWNCIDI